MPKMMKSIELAMEDASNKPTNGSRPEMRATSK
jgi:hypothetical protein